jgi:DNA-binding MarR family transcriptional regulator
MDVQMDLPLSMAKQHREDLDHWAGNWIWRAVQCLVESPEFNPSPKWSASRLNISVEKAVEALDGLERLGVIRREDNTYKVNSNWFQLTPSAATRESLLLAHTKLAPQILSKLTAEDKFTVQFFRGNKELLNKFAPRFIALYKEMNDEAEVQGLTEVIASEVSFAILTHQENGGVQ